MLPKPLVKICSLREPHQAEFAVAAGADAIGLIFAEARRRVTVERAVDIVRELRRLDGAGRMLVVGVFVDQAVDDVNRIADHVELDVVQLHGAEIPQYVALAERPVIKLVRPEPKDVGRSTSAYGQLSVPPVAYLMDGVSSAAVGGTGERADWLVAGQLAESTRLILAGGLTPENVGDAILSVRPFGVDVTSGVETDGVKDRVKVIAFVAAARAAFAALDFGQGGVVPVSEAAQPVHRP